MPSSSRSSRLGRVALVAVFAAAGAAWAQDRGGGGGGDQGGARGGQRMTFGGFPGGFNPMGQQGGQLAPETVDRYEKILGLTPEQHDQVHQAFNAYRAQYDAEEAAMQEKINKAREEARNSDDPAAMRNMFQPRQDFNESAAKMEREFMGQVRGVLTAEQAGNWVRLERTIRREKAGSGMFVAGAERTDLVQILDKMELPAALRASLDPVLVQYEEDLDRVLATRGKINDEIAAKLRELRPQGGGGAPGGAGAAGARQGNQGGRGGPGGGMGAFQEMLEKLQPTIDKAKDASSKVQDVNRRYASKVQSLLPEDRRATFIKAVKESKFPDVYRPSLAGRQLAAAMEMPDLDEKQKAAVRALRDSYLKDAVAVNDQLAAATEKDEAERMSQPGLGFGRPRGGQGGARSELGDLRQDKRDLDRETMAELAKLLTESQVEKLPKAGPQDRGFGGGGFGGGGFQRFGDQGGQGGQGGGGQRPRGGRGGNQNGGGGR